MDYEPFDITNIIDGRVAESGLRRGTANPLIHGNMWSAGSNPAPSANFLVYNPPQGGSHEALPI